MKITKNNGILLGAGLLGATTLIGFAVPASARPDRDVKEAREDVREARKDVREDRRDLREADSREERRDEREDLRDSREDLRGEKRDLREERRENRDDYGYRNNGYRNNSYRPGYKYGNRPGYGNGNRPGYNNGGYRPYNGPRSSSDSNNRRTIEGVVVNDLRGNDFLVRTRGGQVVRVLAAAGESRRISRGDIVEVTGYTENGTLVTNRVNILRNR